MLRFVSPLVSIVAPVYNEAENIAQFVRGIEANILEPHETLIIYDFPEDNTIPVIKSMGEEAKNVRLVHNTLGKGVLNAIKAGFAASKGDVIVFMAADCADEPADVPPMVKLIREGADVVAGSRYMPGGAQHGKKLFKQFLSKFAGLTLHHFAGLPTHDATNNFRAYSRRVIELPIETTASFALGIELVVKAHARGWVIKEIPSTWKDRVGGESRFRLFAWLPEYLKWYFMAYRYAWFPGKKPKS
jgi:glycosyltransferase involved in cell wall biosynthesis